MADTKEFIVRNHFTEDGDYTVYRAEYHEVIKGGVLHLYNTNEKNRIRTVAYIAPPYDAEIS